MIVMEGVFMFGKFGGGEVILILVVVLLLFGARKLPELARSLGASAKEFRKGIEQGSNEDEDDTTSST
jgi:sec-independent protein translocase protein TatA